MRRLVLVRHGESIWNAEARVQGQQCAGLSEAGHAQAVEIGRSLAAVYPDAELVTSDLRRTIETIAPLARMLGRTPRHEPRLRERRFGAWEGRLRAEVRAEQPDRWERWLAGADIGPEIGGESRQELADRAELVLGELLASTPSGMVTVAVSHGGPIWHGTQQLLGVAPGTFSGVANASVTELLASDAGDHGTVVLDRWNELAHLPAELRLGPVLTAAADAPPVGR